MQVVNALRNFPSFLVYQTLLCSLAAAVQLRCKTLPCSFFLAFRVVKNQCVEVAA